MPKGFEGDADHRAYQEIPDYAVLIQNAAAQIGIKLNLKIEDQDAYYGTAEFGKSDWLDSAMGITDYGHRGVPNVLLAAPLLSDGAWNAAHFKNPDYDKLVAEYVGRAPISAIAARDRGQDRDAAARRDADHLRLFLRLPDRDRRGRQRRHGTAIAQLFAASIA